MGKKANLRDVMNFALTTGERLAFALGALYHGALNGACGEHAINDVNEQAAMVMCHLDKDSEVTCKPTEAGETESPAEKKDEALKEKVRVEPDGIEKITVPPGMFLDFLKFLSVMSEECNCPKCVARRAEKKRPADGEEKPDSAEILRRDDAHDSAQAAEMPDFMKNPDGVQADE